MKIIALLTRINVLVSIIGLVLRVASKVVFLFVIFAGLYNILEKCRGY